MVLKLKEQLISVLQPSRVCDILNESMSMGLFNETTHYVFEGTEPIFEKKIEQNKIKSYVYALGKHLARVDGVIGDTQLLKSIITIPIM